MINYILYFLELIEEGNPPVSSHNLGFILCMILCLIFTISIGIAFFILVWNVMNKEKELKEICKKVSKSHTKK